MTMGEGVNEKIEIISSSDYYRIMTEEIEPKLEKLKTASMLKPNGLYYERYNPKNEKGAIVICHGFTETAEKYKEMIWYFLKMDLAVYIFDLRGHGRSVREVKDMSMVHISRFEDYTDDLHDFIGKVVQKNSKGPVYLYGHSLGGGICARYLELYPDDIEKAILSTPMVKIGMVPISERGVVMITSAMCKAKHDKDYGPGQTPYAPGEQFEQSSSTNEARFTYYRDKRDQKTAFQMGGADYSWIREAYKACRLIRRSSECAKIKAKLLMFESTNDAYIDSAGLSDFAGKVKECKHIRMDNTCHEMFNSDDDVMEKYIAAIRAFVEE